MKKFLMAGVALATLTPAPAFAQDTTTRGVNAPSADTQANAQTAEPANTDAAAPGDIIVTAQKRSERLQDVPLAVTVIGGDLLNNQGRTSIEGAQYLVPALNFAKSGTTLNQSIFLRGVGTATFSIAGEPSVSTVVDGVVFSRAGEAFSDLVDIDRMEVLRGPQGTLFGKNASAGVINITSKQPTRELGGYVEAGYFSRAEYRGRAVLNVPFSDSVRTRFTGFYDNWDGNVTNAAHGGTHVNGFEHYGGRAQLVADLSPAVTLTLIGDYHHNDDDCCADIIGTGTPVVVNNVATGFTTTNAVFTALPTPRGDRTRAVNQDLVTSTVETGYGFSGQLDITGTLGTVTSITSYRNWRNTEIRDGDWLDRAYIGFNQLHDFGPQTGDTFTQELRLSSPGHQLIDYVVGGFYSRAFSERVFTRNDQVCTSAVTPAPTALTPCSSTLANPSTFPSGTADFGSTFKNLAFFGQATINIASRFRLIGGLRYTSDELGVFHRRTATGLATNGAGQPTAAPGIQPAFDQGVFDRYNQLVAGGSTVAAALAAAPLGSNGIPFRTKTHSDNWSGKGGFQFEIVPQSTLYATYSRGYKGPAYNIFFNLTATGTNRISPETSDAYEAGLKNSLLNGRLVINIAGFYAKYHNFQANNPDLVAGVVVTRFTNAGEISTRGGELDLIWQPARDFTISGGGAYTDAHVDQFFAAPGAAATAIVPAGTPLGFAPKWKGNLNADYRYRTGGSVDFFGGVQASYQSSELSLFAPDPVQRQLGTIHAYGLINLSAGIVTANDRVRVTAQVRNLLDQSFAAAIVNGGPAGAYRYQIPRDADRYYGVTARVGF
ncbi:TonB-dependent receptor [Sphingomonas sp.]|uniref:TonB-dependent receptor n=1 Tax=Sphingomonas sp. TaxID=28214 RepID=UPI003CC57E01